MLDVFHNRIPREAISFNQHTSVSRPLSCGRVRIDSALADIYTPARVPARGPPGPGPGPGSPRLWSRHGLPWPEAVGAGFPETPPAPSATPPAPSAAPTGPVGNTLADPRSGSEVHGVVGAAVPMSAICSRSVCRRATMSLFVHLRVKRLPKKVTQLPPD